AIEQPVRTNQIPRQIPEQSFFTKPIPGIVMGGILPFGCIFIQLFFILNSIWSHQMYYMFGFLFLVFIILLITCSEATILLCYFHLCAEVRVRGLPCRAPCPRHPPDAALNSGGLPLVVEVVPDQRLHSGLPVHLRSESQPLLRSCADNSFLKKTPHSALRFY
ncbi:hypothetical protein JZ751_016557, partial [Albula glossodonta]